MNVKVESDITPEVARQLRMDADLTQREFWGAVGSNQASGHWFEGGKRKAIPKPIRMLIFLRYVANLDVAVDNHGTAASLVRIGNEISARLESERASEVAKDAALKAKEAAKRVRQIAP